MAAMQDIIRPMEFKDVDSVYSIETKAHIAPWSRGIIHDCIDVGYGCFVLESVGNIYAYIILRIACGECHILNLCVAPDQQGRGLGKKLLEFSLQMARKHCYQATLEVRPSNKAALALYKGFNFEQVGLRKDYYTGPTGNEDGIILSLQLTPS